MKHIKNFNISETFSFSLSLICAVPFGIESAVSPLVCRLIFPMTPKCFDKCPLGFSFLGHLIPVQVVQPD